MMKECLVGTETGKETPSRLAHDGVTLQPVLDRQSLRGIAIAIGRGRGGPGLARGPLAGVPLAMTSQLRLIVAGSLARYLNSKTL